MIKRTRFENGIATNAQMSAFPSLWDGLVGFWDPSLGKQGDKLYDFSGYRRNAAITGVTPATDYINGPFGYGLDLDGNGDYLVVTSPYQLDDASKDLTVCFRVRATSTGSTARNIIAFDANNTLAASADFYIVIKTTLTLGGFGDTSEYVTGIDIQDSLWHDWAVVLRGTDLLLYQDGSLVWSQSVSRTHSNYNSLSALKIGSSVGLNYFLGQVERFCVYTRALGSSEVALLSAGASPLQLAEDSPVGKGSGQSLNSEENITISDEITFDVDKTLNLPTENITIADEIQALSLKTVSEGDSFVVSDEISIETNVNSNENITIDDSIEVKVSVEKVSYYEDITISDDIVISLIGGAIQYAKKVISLSSTLLCVITNTNPVKIVLVNITDPENIVNTKYTYPTTSYALDAVYNSVFDFVYVACADGKILKISGSDFSSYTILNTSDTDNFVSLSQLDNYNLFFGGTDEITGELISADLREYETLNLDIRVLEELTKSVSLQINLVEGLYFSTDIRVLATTTVSMGLDIRVIATEYAEIIEEPIPQTAFKVYINGSEVTDVPLDSIEIYHAIDDTKAIATFQLVRRHDAPNITIAGVSSQITNKNAVVITINGITEFSGKIATWKANSEQEIIDVTAWGTKQTENFQTIKIPFASTTEHLHPYHCLVNNPLFENPELDEDDENPPYYNGIKVNLGTLIKQRLSSGPVVGFSGAELAEAVMNGEFKPEQNWTYFWFVTATNFLTGTTYVNKYIGTSPGSLTGNSWLITDASYYIQRKFEDSETELGEYTLGTAPYKEISCQNGKKITKYYLEDGEHSILSKKDESYDYSEYAKAVAAIEYEKIKTINGTTLPVTSSDIEIMLDAYYFYNIKLLTRINVDNTTEANIFNGLNGFPVAVKTIKISARDMRVTLSCDNKLSDIELEALNDQYPDEEDDEYLFPAKLISRNVKWDYNSEEEMD